MLQSTQTIQVLDHRAPCANIAKHGGAHATHMKRICRPSIHTTKRTYAIPALPISIGLPLDITFKRRTISILNRYKMARLLIMSRNAHGPR